MNDTKWPCQYCRRFNVEDEVAQRAFRAAVWPCCRDCAWFPLTVGVGGLLMFVPLLAWAAWELITR